MSDYKNWEEWIVHEEEMLELELDQMCDYGMDVCDNPQKRDKENCLGCWVISPRGMT